MHYSTPAKDRHMTVIPEAAVEAATMALTKGRPLLPKYLKAKRDDARAALEAAAPHLIRDALACGWDAAVAAMVYPDGTKVEVAENSNPYEDPK